VYRTLKAAEFGLALTALPSSDFPCASADYTTSQDWANAVHGANLRLDRIRHVARQINRGFAYAMFKRSGPRKLGAEKLKARQVDELCDRFNVTAA
jgi:hypothetical protein